MNTITSKIVLLVVFLLGTITAYSESVPAKDSIAVKEKKEGNSVNVPTKDSVAAKTETVQNSVVTSATGGKDSAKVTSSSPKVSETEEELILEGGEDDLLGGKASNKPLKVVDTSAKKVVIDSTKKVEPVNNIGITESNDKPVKAGLASGKSVIKDPKPAVTKPIKIEDVNSINFAKNLKEYRSPKLAMLMSAIIPGTGQAYAKSGLKAALFGAVEVAIIGAGVAYAVKGGDQIDKAHSFANVHYSVDAFNSYAQKVKNRVSDTVFNKVIFSDSATFANFKKGCDGYYDIINDEASPYVRGWDDVTPKLTDNIEIVGDTSYHQIKDSAYYIYKGKDTATYAYGYSQNQKIFNDKLSKGNRYYKVSQGVFTILLVNHLVSAIDALITAKAYNDRLLGKQSFWQKINLEEQVVTTGSTTTTGYALSIKF